MKRTSEISPALRNFENKWFSGGNAILENRVCFDCRNAPRSSEAELSYCRRKPEADFSSVSLPLNSCRSRNSGIFGMLWWPIQTIMASNSSSLWLSELWPRFSTTTLHLPLDNFSICFEKCDIFLSQARLSKIKKPKKIKKNKKT